MNDLIERTAEQERAAIVAWLRRIDTVFARMSCPFKSFADVADTIERGDHIEHSGYAETNNGRAAIIEECAAVADGWNPGRKDRVTETGIATAIRELSGDTREGISAPTQRMAETLGARFVISGEGRSGAGEDAWLRDAADKIIAAVKADDDCRGRGKFEVMQIIAALNARQSGEGERATCADNARVECEGERLRDVLVEHFPTGVRGLYEQSAQRIPVQTYVGTNCLCGWCTSATDEHEVREEWAAHVLAALRATDDAGWA